MGGLNVNCWLRTMSLRNMGLTLEEFSKESESFIDYIVISDKTWAYYFIQKQKKFIELKDTDYTTSLKFKVIWSMKKGMDSVFCGWKLEFVANYLLNGFTNGRKCYNDKLYRLKIQSRKKFVKIWEIVSIYFGTSLQVKRSTLLWLR